MHGKNYRDCVFVIKIIYQLQPHDLSLDASAHFVTLHRYPSYNWTCIQRVIMKCHKCDKNYLPNSKLTVHIESTHYAQMFLHNLWFQSDNNIKHNNWYQASSCTICDVWLCHKCDKNYLSTLTPEFIKTLNTMTDIMPAIWSLLRCSCIPCDVWLWDLSRMW